MKKLIAILMLTLGVSSLYAEDSYLWWFVMDNPTTHANGWDTGWTGARIVAKQDGQADVYLNLYNATGVDSGTLLTNIGDDGSTKGSYWASLSGVGESGWTYFLEVYNSDNGWNGMSATGLSRADAENYIVMNVGGTEIPGAIFDFGTIAYSAVPEPNSAMLLLIGLSALALRRKQKKA